MRGTFNTPFGKLRVSSMRRFILVRDHERGPFIVKRSDTRSNLMRFARTGDYILDTVEREEASTRRT